MAGSTPRDLVSSLWKPRRGKTNKGIVKKAPKGSIVPSAGVGGWSATSSGAGAGAQFPLTETSTGARQYYTKNVVYSSDGIFSFDVTPIKKLQFRDKSGKLCEMFFKPDPAPT
jgi:hypothetical protein